MKSKDQVDYSQPSAYLLKFLFDSVLVEIWYEITAQLLADRTPELVFISSGV